MWFVMRIRSQRDFWAGILFLGIAAFFVVTATNYQLGTVQRMGPGYFPIAVGCVLALLGAIIMVRSLMFDGPPIEQFGLRELGFTMLSVALFGVALVYLGLVAAIVVLVVVGAFADRTSRPIEVVMLAIFLSVFSVLVFVHLLGLPLQVWPEL
jgi:hypothetical protein